MSKSMKNAPSKKVLHVSKTDEMMKKLDALLKVVADQNKKIEELQQKINEREQPEEEAINVGRAPELHLEADNGLLFGTCNEKYSITKMIELFNSDAELGVHRAETYIKKFFAPLEDNSYYVKYTSNIRKEFNLIPIKDIMHHIGFHEKKDGDKFVWSSKNFIVKKYHERYVLSCNPNVTKTVYKDDETEDLIINTFRGYLHKTQKEFKDFPVETRNAVKKIWNHIKEGWCSSQLDQFEYLKNWVCKFVSGNKMKTGLYIKGIEGVGKSIIAEFLMFKVLGKHNCQTVSDPSCFLPGSFNDHLIGKILVLLEEIPSSSSHAWKCLYNSLKPWITNPIIEIKKKYSSNTTMQNIATLMLISNNKCINIGENDRRWFMPDVSMKYVGNKKYFVDLAALCDSNEVGEAFYWYCKEYFKNNCKDFDESDPSSRPKTRARTEIVNDNLHTMYLYIKNEYIMKGRGIVSVDDKGVLLKDFRNEYLKALLKDKRRIREYKIARYKHHDEISPQEVTRKLAEIGIQTVRKNTGMTINIPFEDLRKIYEKKQWLDEDFDMQYEEEVSLTNSDTEYIEKEFERTDIEIEEI